MNEERLSSAMSAAEWAAMPKEAALALLHALQIRLTNGDRPTYTLNGPQPLAVRFRGNKPGQSNGPLTTRSYLEGKLTGSSVLINEDNVRYSSIVLTPLSVQFLKDRVQSVQMGVGAAFDALSGFGQHMGQVMDLCNNKLLDDLRQQREQAEIQQAEQMKSAVAFRNSDDWGEF